MITPIDWAGWAGTVTGASLVLVQLLKDLFVDNLVPAGKAHDALLRLLNYALNFLLMLAVLAAYGSLDGQSLLLNLFISLGQSVGSHVGYSLISTSVRTGSGSGASDPNQTDGP